MNEIQVFSLLLIWTRSGQTVKFPVKWGTVTLIWGGYHHPWFTQGPACCLFGAIHYLNQCCLAVFITIPTEVISAKFQSKYKWVLSSKSGFPQLLKNHWNSDLLQDHWKIIEFHEKFLKFVRMTKSWKNHWILDQSLMEKSLNSEIDVVLTNHLG